jgi:carboxypeptidase C (cathepsin A)
MRHLILILTLLPTLIAAQAPSVTQHRITMNGRVVPYTATTGFMDLAKEDGTITAKVFYIAYTRDDTRDRSTRPVTFSFNGGPGSSSVWLHMGALGPKRVVLSDIGEMMAPPFKYVDNEYTWLDETDLVFIDPVSTGYSRAMPESDAKNFHGFNEDIQSVGEFIRLWTTRNQRWGSPKYLAGESYGTTRAAGLAEWLQNRHGMYINGLMMISSIMDFSTARFSRGHQLPHILFLPTYTATAWYHGKLDADLQADLSKTLDEVRRFALGDYTAALMKGDQLPADERARVVRALSRYTGLSQTYIEQTNLRIEIGRFVKELTRLDGHTVGRLDSRMKAFDYDDAGERYEFDPSYNATIYGPYTSTLNEYIRKDLRFESDLPYEILTGRVQPWNYSNVQNQFLNVAESLRSAMHRNPHLRVWISNGYYDLATPFFATEYTVNQMYLDPSLRKNITMTYYESGHMMYIHMPSLVQFKKDFVGFIRP